MLAKIKEFQKQQETRLRALDFWLCVGGMLIVGAVVSLTVLWHMYLWS